MILITTYSFSDFYKNHDRLVFTFRGGANHDILRIVLDKSDSNIGLQISQHLVNAKNDNIDFYISDDTMELEKEFNMKRSKDFVKLPVYLRCSSCDVYPSNKIESSIIFGVYRDNDFENIISNIVVYTPITLEVFEEFIVNKNEMPIYLYYSLREVKGV